MSLYPSKRPSVHTYSDASGTYGCVAFDSHLNWFQLVWPISWVSIGIAAKELLPVIVAATLWGHTQSGEHVAFHADNMAVVAVLQHKTAKDLFLTDIVCCLGLYAAWFKSEFSYSHIPGNQNTAVDALSRDNLDLFSLLSPAVASTTGPYRFSCCTRHRTGAHRNGSDCLPTL